MKDWKEPDAVVGISGTHDYLVRRELEKAKAALRSSRTISEVDVSEIQDCVNSNSFFDISSLFILRSESKQTVSKDTLDFLCAHKDKDQCIFILHEGSVTDTSLLGQMMKQTRITHKDFESPKPWLLEKAAATFLVNEAKAKGLSLKEDLAAAMVEKAGTDLGFLEMELLKLNLYMHTLETRIVQPDHITGILTSLGSSDYRSLTSALETRHRGRIWKAVAEIQSGSIGSAGVVPVARTVSTTVINWLQISALLDQGLSEQEMADRLGMKTTRISNLVPIVRTWGTQALSQLIRGMAKADKAQRSGHISPWTVFQVELLSACKAQ